MTSTYFLHNCLKNIPNYTTVLPIDHLDKVEKWFKTYEGSFPKSFVINTEPSNVKSGGHWILTTFFKTNKYMTIEIFDSLALGSDSLPAELGRQFGHLGKLVYSNLQIQAYTSDYCGLFCLYRCLSINIGQPLDLFYKSFSMTNLNDNDKKVVLLIEKYVEHIRD